MNLADTKFRLLVVVGIAAMLLLFISFLLVFIFTQRKKLKYQRSIHNLQVQQQQQLVEAAVRSEETERLRIAEELHDEVGALLSSAKLHLRSISPPGINQADQQIYRKGNDLLDEAIKKIRTIAQSTHSLILQEFGLNEAISHFADHLTDNSVLKISVSLDEKAHMFSYTLNLAIYRIVQELLNNILKHGQPNYVQIRSFRLPGYSNFQISHNGTGLTQGQFEELRYKNNGLGLKNIQNRINLLKGHIEFVLEKDTYLINLQIPLSDEHTQDKDSNSR